KLLGDDLIGVDVRALQHRDPSFDQLDGLHLNSSRECRRNGPQWPQEQPASRHSNPADRNTSSSPSASASAFTCWEPGTTIARTERATFRPSTIDAASRRSLTRELEQEPMKTRA